MTAAAATPQTAGYHSQNIFKSMKDIDFKQTISHQCGVTMNDSVEARAIADFMGEKPGVTVTYQPALIRIDGEGKLIFKMDEISNFLGRDMTAEIFEVNTSTHYGRMVRTDDNTVVLFGDMDEMLQYT
jgi:propane monooxygenase coupling protein